MQRSKKPAFALIGVVAVAALAYYFGCFAALHDWIGSLWEWITRHDYWADAGSAAGGKPGVINADKINKAVQTIVFVAGGIGAYFRFFYGQTLFHRIDPSLKAEIQEVNDIRYLAIHVSAKNVGLAGVSLEQDATKVFLYQGIKEFRAEQPKSVYWIEKEWGVFDVFGGQEWIRSGETACDELLIELPPYKAFQAEIDGTNLELPPDKLLALKICLRVIGRRNLFNLRGNEWVTFCILIMEKPATDRVHVFSKIEA